MKWFGLEGTSKVQVQLPCHEQEHLLLDDGESTASLGSLYPGDRKAGEWGNVTAWISSDKIPPLTFLPCFPPSLWAALKKGLSLTAGMLLQTPACGGLRALPCHSVNGGNVMPSPLSSLSHQAKGWQWSGGLVL